MPPRGESQPGRFDPVGQTRARTRPPIRTSASCGTVDARRVAVASVFDGAWAGGSVGQGSQTVEKLIGRVEGRAEAARCAVDFDLLLAFLPLRRPVPLLIGVALGARAKQDAVADDLGLELVSVVQARGKSKFLRQCHLTVAAEPRQHHGIKILGHQRRQVGHDRSPDSARSSLVSEDPDGATQIVVPSVAFRFFVDVLAELANGNAVTVAAVHAELTTQQAADLLNVSRPYLVKLLDERAIPYRRVGNRRKVLLVDLVEYKRRDEAMRREIADELTREAQEIALSY